MSPTFRIVLSIRHDGKPKRDLFEKWVHAVSFHGGSGTRHWIVSRDPKDVAGLLARASTAASPQ